MRKISTLSSSGSRIFKARQLTIGLDLGDRCSCYCVLNEVGESFWNAELPTTPESYEASIRQDAAEPGGPGDRSTLAVGQPAVGALGHEVIVAHARNVRLIGESRRKDDRIDARTLARLARVDPQLAEPGATSQRESTDSSDGDPGARRAGEGPHGLGEFSARTGEVLWRAARQVWHAASEARNWPGIESGVARSTGAAVARGGIAERSGLRNTIGGSNKMATGELSQVELLKQVKGVGDLIALTYVLTIGRPASVPQEPRGGLLLGLRTGTQELRAERTTDAHQQGRRPVSADAVGARGALHSGALWGGQ